jgi:hypothetical protein
MTRFAGFLALLVLAVGACASPIVVGVNSPVSVYQVPDFRMDEDDPIVPVRITHNSEQIWNGETLEQNYNYLVYEFETENHLYRARSYLDEFHTVAIFGPFEKNAEGPMPLEGVEIDQRVISYLRRRYAEVRRFGPTGYEPIEFVIRSE